MSLRILVKALASHPLARIGGPLLLALALIAIIGPAIYPHTSQDLFDPLAPPSRAHPLGTNDLGQDLLGELLHGARVSLGLGATAALAACFLGTLVGVTAGAYPRLGGALMRLVDLLIAVPRFPLIVLMAAFTRPGIGTLWLFFSLFGWPSVARIVHAAVLAERTSGYVLAARAIGATRGRILTRHLLPAALPMAFTRFVREMQHVIVAEAGLSFLGLGNPAVKSWGMTLSQASRYPALFLGDAWQWWVLPPGFAIALVCLALSFLGLGLETLTNPRLR
ncbi:MAG: ABC transporter permease [Anaerolineae bacterium]